MQKASGTAFLPEGSEGSFVSAASRAAPTGSVVSDMEYASVVDDATVDEEQDNASYQEVRLYLWLFVFCPLGLDMNRVECFCMYLLKSQAQFSTCVAMMKTMMIVMISMRMVMMMMMMIMMVIMLMMIYIDDEHDKLNGSV